MGRGRGRLDWVEAGRGLAACLVMASHSYVVRPLPIDPALTDWLGDVGVGFFFVLSGFIMVHVHGGDVGRPETVARFAWRRLVRIWPTYWLVLAIALGVNALRRPDAQVHPDLGWIGRQLVIWPGAPPFVGPAWTLRHELLFYALFSLLLVDRRIGFFLLATWTAALATGLMLHGLPTGHDVSWGMLLFHPINLFFPIGMALGWADRAGRVVPFAAGAAAAGVGFLLAADARGTLVGEGLLYAGLLGGLVRASAGGRGPGAALVRLGAMSYALYLLHLSVFTLLRGLLAHGAALDPVWPVRVVGQMAVAIAAAALLHAGFERPLLAWAAGRRRGPGPAVDRAGSGEVAALS